MLLSTPALINSLAAKIPLKSCAAAWLGTSPEDLLFNIDSEL